MSILSNLYAEKVFSEHPISLWALDDQADYVSLISETNRSFAHWQIENGSSQIVTNVVDEPFITSVINKVTGSPDSNHFQKINCVGPDIFNFTELNTDLGTFSVAGYIYSLTPYINGINIGYEYYDSTTGQNIQNVKHYDTSIYNQWIFVAETFHIPLDNTTARPFISIEYINSNLESETYEFLINGISVGQWSEEFNTFSLGVVPTNIPSDINLSSLKGIQAKSYGLDNTPGYYIADETSLSARNSGVPMVYGASNTTTIISNDNNLPGLIIPGKGFLNEVGKFKDYTVEMWLKVDADSYSAKRIFGPISSTDGLYVDGPFLLLKINNHVGSFFVGEWSRPMLLDIRVTKNSANLLINGEQVISLNFITDTLVFPNEYTNNKSNDWLGFYAYTDIFPLEVDCVGIYPYQVPAVVAKKRFIYGQGVEIPENINRAYSGNSVFIDYTFANYANNYNYPDIGKWSKGILNNLVVENNELSIPQYKLPTFISNNKSMEQLYQDNREIQNEENNFITFKPNTNWNSSSSYLFFDTINPINDQVKCIWSTFKYTNNIETPQVLIRIQDQLTNNYISIELIDNLVNYIVSDGANITTLYKTDAVLKGDHFSVGIAIDQFSNFFGGSVAKILGNKNSLCVYVGGTKDFTKTFTGKIYSINFENEFNYSKISDLFDDNGITKEYLNVFNTYSSLVDYDAGNNYFGTYTLDGVTQTLSDKLFWDYVLDGGNPSSFATTRLFSHKASYSVKPSIYFNIFELDIDVVGYWEDNLPLTYFAKYVTNSKGNKIYDLDFLQFNVNYPAPLKYEEVGTYSLWKYSDLESKYQIPIQKTYNALDNHLYTGYNDYSDLALNASKVYSFDTTNSFLKSYITFQYTKSGANQNANSFKYVVKPQTNGVVIPGSYQVDIETDSNTGNKTLIYDSFINTKYEIVDNTIIYPPSGIDFNDLSIVVHCELDVEKISKNPIRIRSLQLASQALDFGQNKIGTRFGNTINPYIKRGIYFDYKNKNPFSIYKGSTPYLYLTRKSGIQVRGMIDPTINRGLSIPINSSLSSNYKVIAMQIATRYDQDYFPASPTEIFEIESKNGIIKFFIIADSPKGQRGKIYAINATTGKLENGITFYLNGSIVSDPVLTVKQWSILGISFSNILNFNNFVGAFRINGPLLVNLISDYKSTNLQEVQTVTKRPWFKVRYAGVNDLNWDFWDIAYKWQGVLVLSSTSYYGVNPSDVYKSYAGTNKIIVDDYNSAEQNPKILSFKDYEYNIYTDLKWQTVIQNPV
jgi:hypothetical protein